MGLGSFILIACSCSLAYCLGSDKYQSGGVLPRNSTMTESNKFKTRVEILADTFRHKVDEIKDTPGNKVELVFIVDASSSVGEDNFENELKFVRKLLSDFTLGPNATRVAIIVFSTEIETSINHIGSNHEVEKCSLLQFEMPLVRYLGGNTFTLGALQEAENIFNKSRSDAKKALFLITDGFSNNGDPLPVAAELKRLGVKIFTLGINNGNVDELYSIASPPADEYCYILESFMEFEAVARRALHQDLSPGYYKPVLNQDLCGSLCNSTGKCCNVNSTCSCGTLSGHFSCLCPPGYYGSGLKEEICLPCPKGTFNAGLHPGDISVCQACPDQNQNTKIYPASAIGDCVCKEGFEPVGNLCEVIRCPKLISPENGYFVKGNCSNVLNAACGVRCSIGYELEGSSVRICQINGTWSGTSPLCLPKRCPALKPVRNGDVLCTHDEEGFEVFMQFGEEGEKKQQVIKRKGKKTVKLLEGNGENFIVDTICKFNCPVGFSHVGSKTRNCLPVTRWDGLQTTCKPIICPSLPKLTYGNIEPANCTVPGIKHKYGAECSVSCREGFFLKGNTARNCTGKYGTWTGKGQSNKCVDVQPPMFSCPENLTLTTDKGKPYATVNFTLPVATDNSGVDPILWTKPADFESENIKSSIGLNQVEIFGVDPTGNLFSCSFWIEVLDKEPPKVESCLPPGPLTLSDLSNSGWQEPDFSDNSGNFTLETSQVISQNITSVITFTAKDTSGNMASCSLNISLIEDVCSIPPAPSNANVTCTNMENQVVCSIICREGFTSAEPNVTVICDNGTWSSGYIHDCSEIVHPEKVVHSNIISIEAEDDSFCAKKENLIEMENSIATALNDKVPNVKLECIEEEQEELSNVIWDGGKSKRRKRQRMSKRRFRITVEVLGMKEGKPLDMNENLLVTDAALSRFGSEVTKKGESFQTKLICVAGSVQIRNHCVKCAIGYFFDNIKKLCKPCLLGFYQDIEGSFDCKSCPKGMSTINSHSRTNSECRRVCPCGTCGAKTNAAGLELAPCRSCDRPVVQCQKQKKANACASSPCLNNAICIEEPFLCICSEGFIGATCEKPLKPCNSSPCLNGATCIDHSPTNYTCNCPAGYFGEYCQLEINHCSSSPCRGHGECSPILKGFVCDCFPPFQGETCDTLIDTCASVRPCQNGGACINKAESSFNCECINGYTGRYCDVYNGCLKEEEWFCSENTTEVSNSHLKPTPQPPSFQQPDLLSHSEMNLTENAKIEFAQINLPEYIVVDINSQNIDELSCCLWLVTSDKQNFGTLFSYATRLHDNAFTLTDYNGLVLYVLGRRVITDIAVNDNFWHLICATWSSHQGFWNIYVDGKMAASGFGLQDGMSIQGTGKMVIGQEQDSLGGGFNKAESFVGSMTHVNVWSKALSASIIQELAQNCNNSVEVEGSLVPWGMFLRNLRSNIKSYPFQFCNDCGTPSFLFRGSFFTTGNKAFYSCNLGFQMKFINGLSLVNETHVIRKCLKTGEWEPFNPICSRINCGLPGSIYHGAVIGKSFLYEDIIEYKCHRGYNLVGPKQRTCKHDGKWSSEKAACIEAPRKKCVEPTAPKRGSMFFLSQGRHRTSLNTRQSDQVEFVCDPGYHIHGASVVTCLNNGEWDSSMPICSLCPSPQLPRNITWNYSDNSDAISIYCPRTSKIHEISCESGVWLIPDNLCANVTVCSTPNKVTNGLRLHTNESKLKYFEGDKIEFECTEGYKLHGGNTIICMSDTSWNISERSCERIQCKSLAQEVFTYAIDLTADKYFYGDTVTYYCLPGYYSEKDLTISCEANEQWSTLPSACERLSCGKPENTFTLIESDATYLFGDIIELLCPSGVQAKIRCQSNGKWTTPVCS